MIILRNKYFSEEKKKSSDKDKDDDNKDKKEIVKDALLITAGGASILGANKIRTGIAKTAYKNLIKSDKKDTKDKEFTNLRLKGKARRLGINVVKDKDFDNSAYLGSPAAVNSVKDKTPKEIEKLGRQNGLSRKSSKYLGTDSIVMGLGDGNPAVLAHEMGHAAMSRKGRSKDILGKLAHTNRGTLAELPYNLSNYRKGKALAGIDKNNPNRTEIKKAEKIDKGLVRLKHQLNTGIALSGVRHGMKAAQKEEEGDTKGARKEARKGALRTSLIMAPTLVVEGAASRKGLKYLRESGASKETMRNARRGLGHAYMTYASGFLKPVLISAGGTAIGYGVGKLKSKAEKKKKDKEDRKEE